MLETWYTVSEVKSQTGSPNIKYQSQTTHSIKITKEQQELHLSHQQLFEFTVMY